MFQQIVHRLTPGARRLTAGILAACLLLTLLPASALAEGGAPNEAVIVTAFDPLEATVAEQTVPAGTALDALILPGSLRATVYTTAPDTAPIVIEGVTWEPDVLYEGSAGSYVFTASAGGYTLDPDVDWPVIAVTVEEAPAPDEIDALCADIDALPTVEALYENAPGDADPAFADWQAQIRTQLAAVPALFAQLSALTADEAAMGRITEARAGKLTALHDLAARLGEVQPLTGTTVNTVEELNAAITNSSGTAEIPTVITIHESGISVDKMITIDNKHVKLTGGTLTRAASYTGNLIKVQKGGSLTLENITLDGNKGEATGGCLINLNNAALLLEDGATLTNSPDTAINILYHLNGSSSITMNGGTISNNAAKESGGAIKDSDKNTVITIKGGKITGNTANGTDTKSTYGGAIYSSGALIIEGGEITGNSTPNGRGGGIFKTGGKTMEFTMTGGTVSGNTARTSGDIGNNVYVNQCAFTLGDAANIPDGLYLKLGGNYSTFAIASALKNPVEIEAIYNKPSAGTLVASGATGDPGYKITADDLAKFSYKGGTFGFTLDTVNNQIKLANPSYPVTFNLTGMAGSAPLPTSVEKEKDLMFQLVATEGYKLPASSVSVTVGGVLLTANTDYQLQNFQSTCSIWIKAGKITGAVEITAAAVKKGSDATLFALTYWYASTPGDIPVPGFSSTAENPTYNVILPASVAENATIYVDETPSDQYAEIGDNPDYITLVDGKGTWSVTITSEDGKNSNTYTVNFVTTPAAPATSEAVINYAAETISFDSSIYEMNTAATFDGTVVSNGSITDYISAVGTTAQTLYIRVKEADGFPASEATEVSIPARPQTPSEPTVTAGTNTLTVTAVAGVEYTVGDWNANNTNVEFTDLQPGTVYTLKARVAATAGSFRSAEVTKDVRTLTAISTPTGAVESKGSVTADKTEAAVGATVTYTVTFEDGWTPTLRLSGNSGTLSVPSKDGNTWKYTYTVHESDKTVGAAVSFAARRIERVSYTGAVTLFADDERNASADALKTYLDDNVTVTPTYDNGTTGAAVTASYALTTGTWDAKGGSYTYTATVGDKSCAVSVIVKPVTATIGVVSGITKVMRTNGYATHTDLGLPRTATITYTGDGYTKRTDDTLAFSWSPIPANFGKSPGSNEFTGTVTLPPWATGDVNSTTTTVTISDKTPLTDGQMTLTMAGWVYGETANRPQGAVTITDGNGSITYQYSADNGGRWTDELPTSTAGKAKAGTYQVKMSYEDKRYIGEKTISFTVARQPVTLDIGTLTASKPYDGLNVAPLTGTPAISGKLDSDTVTATGGTGAYATADVGTDIAVTVTGFTLTGADAGNYTTDGTVSGLTGTITQADGKTYSGYTAALDALKTVHIVTNVTPTLGDVTLPSGWAFTGTNEELAARLAGNNLAQQQPFPVQYTPADTNYAPVTLTDDTALFPVTTVTMTASGGLDMKTVQIGQQVQLTEVTLEVAGAPLPNEGEYAISNMKWSSSAEAVATVTGAVTGGSMSATVTGHDAGVSMVGVSYLNGGMLGFVLVKVEDEHNDVTANQASDIQNIAETLDKLINPESPTEIDKAVVNTVAAEVTKLPDEKKQELTLENIQALDALKTEVGKSAIGGTLSIETNTDPEDEVVPTPTSVEVVGAAIACGVDSGEVVVTVKPVQPTGANTKLELEMSMTVNNSSQALAAPMFFQMEVPEDINLARLTLYHVKDDGSRSVIGFDVLEGRTISFKMLSFSGVQFVVSTGGSTTYYTLTATAGEGGKIAPNGKTQVSRNSDKRFTITPDEGYEIADVLVDGKSVGAVSTYTFEKVKANHTIEARFRAEGERPVWNPFADVKSGDWYHDSVKYVYERGLMNGTGETAFSPGLSTTRGMIVTMLWRLEQEPQSGADMTFTDVTAGSYYGEAVRWAAEHEIVKGYTATTFGPDNTITRQELAAMLYRYAQHKGADVSVGENTNILSYADIDKAGAWAIPALQWACGAGVLQGKGGGLLDPRGDATRAEAAAMLQRFISATAAK